MPEVSRVYDHLNGVPGAIIPDDEVLASNVRGTLAFSAAYSLDSKLAVNRTTELYVNYLNNSRLDASGFAPVGRVVSGLDVISSFYAGYGEMVDACGLHPEKKNSCNGVNETLLYSRGEEYLGRDFPKLDFVVRAQVVGDPCAMEAPGDSGVGGRTAAFALVPLLSALFLVLFGHWACKRFRKGRGKMRKQVQLRAYTSIVANSDGDDATNGDGSEWS